MFLPCGTEGNGIEIKIVLNDPEFSISERLIEQIKISATYYQSQIIRLDLSGYDVAADDALIILETMASLRKKYGVSFYTETSKTIFFPAAYILFFGDIGHRTLHKNTQIFRHVHKAIGFLQSTTTELSCNEKSMAAIVSRHVQQNAYKRGRYDKIFEKMAGFFSVLTSKDAYRFRFVDNIL